ncbi:hypothetical protein O181_114686 [Austropuccinia psidii MF-1]|uniref:SNF2 N-terminal domain-containing protein n=1 Tax=Austropuccinia psidii MF-1 TaxID=1389203 RepID=A0A9Q3PVI9_9BASI|nr:hypothetical protein [Austropuccinia psidii MF-1]
MLFKHSENLIPLRDKIQKILGQINQPKHYNPSIQLNCPLFQIRVHDPPQISFHHNLSSECKNTLLESPSGSDLLPKEPPFSIVTTRLLPHQAMGLAILCDREDCNRSPSINLWDSTPLISPQFYQQIITQKVIKQLDEQSEVNKLGSILPDDMGLGKTLLAIPLIGMTPKLQIQTPTSTYMTLIICPRLLSNWHDELLKH